MSDITFTITEANPITFVVESGSGGNVRGPSSSTDNALVRFNGTTGRLIQNSDAILDDNGDLVLAGGIKVNTTEVLSKTASYVVSTDADTGDFTDIQSALDALPSTGGTIYVKAGTYTLTSTLLVKVSSTKLILDGGAIVQCNGATVTTALTVNTTGLSRVEIKGGKWLQTNATAQGVCFNMSDTPNHWCGETRIEEFGTAIVLTDAASSSFYSSWKDVQVFNCNNGILLSGTQANNNYFENVRIRPKAGGAGTGISLVDARGATFVSCDVEPATGTGITGINIDATSREACFVNCWIENNATGLNIASGATRCTFIGGTITGNSTDIVDAGTSTVFLNMNRTGTTIMQIPLKYTAITSTTTLSNIHNVVDCTSGTFTVTLPTAVGITGREYTIKNSGSGFITIATTSSQTIDGSLTQTLNQYDSYTLCSNGANWIIA